MWRAYDSLGFLEYSFAETVEAMHPFYIIRMTGGLLFLLGAFLMAYNVYRTAKGDQRDERPYEVSNEPQAQLQGATS